MLTLQPSPCPVEQIASEIADRIFTANWDAAERANLTRLLVKLVSEGCRRMDAA